MQENIYSPAENVFSFSVTTHTRAHKGQKKAMLCRSLHLSSVLFRFLFLKIFIHSFGSSLVSTYYAAGIMSGLTKFPQPPCDIEVSIFQMGEAISKKLSFVQGRIFLLLSNCLTWATSSEKLVRAKSEQKIPELVSEIWALWNGSAASFEQVKFSL